MKLKICLLLLLCPIFGICSQDKSIGIGDRLPDIAIQPVLNTPSGSLRLSSFKGRLLIIDFWATSCASCITALPRLDSLQQQFGDKIAILGVSYEKAIVVRAFMSRNPIGKALHLPVVTDDYVLAGLFHHSFIPHEVWIDETGVVAAITGPEYVNAQNINAFLNHKVPNLPVKTDIADFDYHKPLLTSAAGTYSGIAPYKPGVSPRVGFERDTIMETTRMYAVNSTILQLYLLALHQPANLPPSKISVSVKDSSRLFIPPGTYTEAWNRQHCYCYESVLPGLISNNAEKRLLLADLNRFFRLNGRMETRNVRCLSLQRTSTDNHLQPGRNAAPINTLHSNEPVKLLSGATLSELTWELGNIPGGPLVTDDTGFTGAVDLRLPVTSLRDTAALNLALKPYGLVLKAVTRPVNQFVLNDAE